jgi:hypothetical protein
LTALEALLAVAPVVSCHASRWFTEGIALEFRGAALLKIVVISLQGEPAIFQRTTLQ